MALSTTQENPMKRPDLVFQARAGHRVTAPRKVDLQRISTKLSGAQMQKEPAPSKELHVIIEHGLPVCYQIALSTNNVE
jgi:hypothetical protein